MNANLCTRTFQKLKIHTYKIFLHSRLAAQEETDLVTFLVSKLLSYGFLGFAAKNKFTCFTDLRYVEVWTTKL